MTVSTLGIDLAKNIFQLHGVDERGNVAIQKRVTRNKLRETVAQLPPCLIGMEACGISANLREMGIQTPAVCVGEGVRIRPERSGATKPKWNAM
jgi:hypothetical protein